MGQGSEKKEGVVRLGSQGDPQQEREGRKFLGLFKGAWKHGVEKKGTKKKILKLREGRRVRDQEYKKTKRGNTLTLPPYK